MRARLSQAAFEVIAERGHSGFRVAAVATHAGVSPGALLHHFPNKDAVTVAALEFAFDCAGKQSKERIAQAPRDLKATLALLVEDCRSFFWSDYFWVSLDITMDAAKNAPLSPTLRKIAAQHRKPVYDAWCEQVVKCGWPKPRAINAVRMIAALVSGFAIRTLWTDDKKDVNALLNNWINYIINENK